LHLSRRSRTYGHGVIHVPSKDREAFIVANSDHVGKLDPSRSLKLKTHQLINYPRLATIRCLLVYRSHCGERWQNDSLRLAGQQTSCTTVGQTCNAEILPKETLCQ